MEGTITYADGSTQEIDKRSLIAPDERALILMAISVVAVSVAALLVRV